MTENTSKGKGKRPIRALRDPDGRFLPNLPGPPGRPSPLALEAPAQPRGDGGGTPLPPRGLRFRGTSTLDLFYAERLRKEAGPASEGGRALVPSFQSPYQLLKGTPALNYRLLSYQMFTEPRSLSLTRTSLQGGGLAKDLQPWRPGDFPGSTPH